MGLQNQPFVNLLIKFILRAHKLKLTYQNGTTILIQTQNMKSMMSLAMKYLKSFVSIATPSVANLKTSMRIGNRLCTGVDTLARKNLRLCYATGLNLTHLK